MAQLADIVGLLRRKAELERELRAVTDAIAARQQAALDWFVEAGIDKVQHDGMTLFPRAELWASLAEGASTDDLCAALDAVGINSADIVKERVNTQTLSAVVRELTRDGEVPPELLAVIKVSEVFKLGHREGDESKARKRMEQAA